MAGLGRTHGIGKVTLAIGAVSLSACAVSTPATLTSTQNSPQTLSSVELLNEEDEAGLRAQLLDELTGSFANGGIGVENGAAFIVDFSVSQREASVGIQEISEDAGTVKAIEPTFRSRWYHKCKPSRVSASLVIYARDSGAVQNKSSGEFLTCPDDLSQLGDLAQLLVDGAVAN
ncbi:hypothetical protein [uncultured Erythrobacter sp.]|uniref:hypothetical protein n=1 Tax=uncultured Erythrobacter sp. TaxID=263913 RepID=UPI0026298CA2|nr:hypothetical protein [uncultured Erythrobacter sp.]